MREKSREGQITDAIYERLKSYGVRMPLYPAVLRRVKDLIVQTKDADQVELVCLTLATIDYRDFSAGYSLNWGSYERIMRGLSEDVPDGGWGWALWASKLPHGKMRDRAEFLLGYWHDAQEDMLPDEIARARRMLETVRDGDLTEVKL